MDLWSMVGRSICNGVCERKTRRRRGYLQEMESGIGDSQAAPPRGFLNETVDGPAKSCTTNLGVLKHVEPLEI